MFAKIAAFWIFLPKVKRIQLMVAKNCLRRPGFDHITNDTHGATGIWTAVNVISQKNDRIRRVAIRSVHFRIAELFQQGF